MFHIYLYENIYLYTFFFFDVLTRVLALGADHNLKKKANWPGTGNTLKQKKQNNNILCFYFKNHHLNIDLFFICACWYANIIKSIEAGLLIAMDLSHTQQRLLYCTAASVICRDQWITNTTFHRSDEAFDHLFVHSQQGWQLIIQGAAHTLQHGQLNL